MPLSTAPGASLRHAARLLPQRPRAETQREDPIAESGGKAILCSKDVLPVELPRQHPAVAHGGAAKPLEPQAFGDDALDAVQEGGGGGGPPLPGQEPRPVTLEQADAVAEFALLEFCADRRDQALQVGEFPLAE